MLADGICYWKMTSFMASDGVTPILRKTLQIHINECDVYVVKELAGVLQCYGGKFGRS